jgi:hypothetical protein
MPAKCTINICTGSRGQAGWLEDGSHGTGAKAMGEPNFCCSCGKQFADGEQFCRHCGARRILGTQDRPPTDQRSESSGSSTTSTRSERFATEPTRPRRRTDPSQGVDPPTEEAVLGGVGSTGFADPSGQAGLPGSPPGAVGPGGHPGASPSYPAPPHGPPPPGYPPDYAPQPPAYPAPPGYAAPPQQMQQPKGINGWVIAGSIGGTLALVGIGVAIYLAASGHSSRPAQLLSTPVLTTAAVATTPPAGGKSPTSSHHSASSSPAPTAPITHASRKPPPVLAHSAIDEANERRAAAQTIERHFSLITQHDFSAAYALLAPSLQSGESSWVQAHREDGIYKVEVSVDATLHSHDTATATVNKMTTLDRSGCKRWSGSWGLTKIDGEWRISEASVSPTPC